jgi:hypothetical protein
MKKNWYILDSLMGTVSCLSFPQAVYTGSFFLYGLVLGRRLCYGCRFSRQFRTK